ncbi:MAG: PP2C family protein-serine/threonine phosphatase [Gammaproteobacteria bacterium]
MARKSVRFKSNLLLNLTGIVLLLGLCLLAVSLLVTDRAVQVLSGSLTKRVIATTDAQLLGFFEPVQTALEVAAARIAEGDFESFPLDGLDRYFQPLVDRIPQLSSLSYATEAGDGYWLIKIDGVWRSRLSRPDSWGEWAQVRQWAPGASEKPMQRQALGFDARTRPWHAGALARLNTLSDEAGFRERIYWTAPYEFFTLQQPGLTASLATRVATGGVAILGFDILLADISKFTSQLEVGKRGKVFVLRGKPSDPEGLMVVGLPADQRFETSEIMTEFMLLHPGALGGPMASFAEQALNATGMALTDAQPFEHEGERWWGAIARSKLRSTDDLWVGSLVPESELLAGLPDTNLIVMIVTAIILILAVWRAFYLANRYATPLLELIDHGNRMQRLNFEPMDRVDSDISEIRYLGNTLERMRQALQSFLSEREDLRIARSVRAMTLPTELPSHPGLEVQAWYEPSADVGGEIYDLVPLADGIALAHFDLPGLGVGAAVQGSQLRAAFRTALGDGASLPDVAAQLHRFVVTDLPEAAPVRGWLIRINRDACRLQALGLGQEGLLCRRGAEVQVIPALAGPIGTEANVAADSMVELTLAAGDLVVLVSDGVLDALNVERSQYGSKGVAWTMEQLGETHPVDVIKCLRRDLEIYTKGDAGDQTIVVARLKD